MGEHSMRQHHDLAMGKDVDTGAPKHTATGDLNSTSDDTRAPQAGHGHVHTTDPSSEGRQHHGDYEHGHTSVHWEEKHHGGHKHMHHHHPEHHDGGHGGHPTHGRKKNF